ncbi:MAG: ketoacyl-ACP synthase III [Dehalococcoidia bacterium]|nr:ketoacyl-ACP synthase III [Dehalococcoidia bacterium]
MANYPRIAGWGKALPQRILANSELELLVDTSDEWIQKRTGIKERRIASPGDTPATLATEAGKAALKVAGVSPCELDLIIAAVTIPDKIIPACAFLVQHAIGAERAGAFDINAACSGFVYGLAVASQFISSGTYKNILVVGSEVLSRSVNWQDRSTCILFGDAAGAVLVQASDEPCGPKAIVLGSDGGNGNAITLDGPGSSFNEGQSDNCNYITMDGQEVYRFAINALVSSTRKAVDEAGLTIDDIDLFIPHQANERIIHAATKTLGISPDKVFINVHSYGNTSAASIPVALCEALEQGRIHDGDIVAMTGVGGGLSWATMVYQW